LFGSRDCEDSEALEAWWNARGRRAWRVHVNAFSRNSPLRGLLHRNESGEPVHG